MFNIILHVSPYMYTDNISTTNVEIKASQLTVNAVKIVCISINLNIFTKLSAVFSRNCDYLYDNNDYLEHVCTKYLSTYNCTDDTVQPLIYTYIIFCNC